MQLRKFPGQLFHRVLFILHLAARLHLSGNSANILTSVQPSVVLAAHNKTGLASCNTTNVITDMLISYTAVIVTIKNDSLIGTGNSTDIRYGSCIFRT